MRDQRPFSALARDCTSETGFNRGWSLVFFCVLHVQEYSMSQLTNTWDFHWFVCVFVSYLIQDIGIRCISPLSIIIIIQRLVQRFFPTMRSLFLREGREGGGRFQHHHAKTRCARAGETYLPLLALRPSRFSPMCAPPSSSRPRPRPTTTTGGTGSTRGDGVFSGDDIDEKVKLV